MVERKSKTLLLPLPGKKPKNPAAFALHVDLQQVPIADTAVIFLALYVPQVQGWA